MATWTIPIVGSITPEGTIITRGVGIRSVLSTTGELGFMNNMITIFEVRYIEKIIYPPENGSVDDRTKGK